MTSAWRPSCTLELLHLRAQVLKTVRQYFDAQQLLEVETPVLGRFAGTDPYLCYFRAAGDNVQSWFLQSSPEFAMKRLLAAQSGCIYQISKAFRYEESGRHHNPEFTLIEWYRVGFNLQQLMDDVAGLIEPLLPQAIFNRPAVRLSYRDVFAHYTGLDIVHFSLLDYQTLAEQRGLVDAARLCGTEQGLWLDFLFSHLVQPHLGGQQLTMIYDYPACLPSLARHKVDEPLLVERFEVFLQGMEMGNGFFELNDALEQERRFDADNAYRQAHEMPLMQKDSYFLAALQQGLPDCSGVALGLDRLLMVLSQKHEIAEVLAFPISCA